MVVPNQWSPSQLSLLSTNMWRYLQGKPPRGALMLPYFSFFCGRDALYVTTTDFIVIQLADKGEEIKVATETLPS